MTSVRESFGFLVILLGTTADVTRVGGFSAFTVGAWVGFTGGGLAFFGGLVYWMGEYSMKLKALFCPTVTGSVEVSMVVTGFDSMMENLGMLESSSVERREVPEGRVREGVGVLRDFQVGVFGFGRMGFIPPDPVRSFSLA